MEFCQRQRQVHVQVGGVGLDDAIAADAIAADAESDDSIVDHKMEKQGNVF